MVIKGDSLPRMVPLLLIAVLVSVTTCKSPDADEAITSGQRIVHPISMAIPGFDQAHNFIVANPATDGDSDMQAVVRALLSATETMTLGLLEGERHEMFGSIADIDVDADGNMYVLDSQFSEIRVYSAEGTFVYAIGRAGQGPNEFSAPRFLDVNRSGRVIVADQNYGIKIFERTGDTHGLAATVPLSFAPKGMCVENDILHVQGSRAEDLSAIFSFSLSGDRLGSFGASYESSSLAVRTILTNGRIVCMRQPASVMYFPQFLPAIYGYSYEGHMQWVAKIAKHESLDIVEEQSRTSGRSRVSMNVFGTTYDVIMGAVEFPERRVIVQIASITPESIKSEDGERYAELRTYLMSARTGEAIFVTDTMPPVYAVTADRMYTVRTHPFPQITVYHLTSPAS